jgi:hypothetical protein
MNNLEQRRADLVAKVKLVLANAGVQAPAYAKTLSSVLDVGIAQAYRKLSGASPFTLPQIEAIELAYGVELLSVQFDASGASSKGIRTWTKATFVIAGRELACQAILGAARKGADRRYAAFLRRGAWFICLPEDHNEPEPLFDVEALAMTPSN